MKMLFFSPDDSEIEEMSRQFAHAGIPCEVHASVAGESPAPNPPDRELWIQNDQDSHRALLLCVQLGIGFARRPASGAEADEEREVWSAMPAMASL
jgi:hypothetical protein